MIAERQKRYPLWRLIHLLGSLKLALLLLATIAIAFARPSSGISAASMLDQVAGSEIALPKRPAM